MLAFVPFKIIMAQTDTLKIRSEGGEGFTVINRSDYDESQHDLVVNDGEMVVKPLNVENAKPFIIGEKDFDAAAYEKVTQTKAVIAEVAHQVNRKPIGETDAIIQPKTTEETAAADQAETTAKDKATPFSVGANPTGEATKGKEVLPAAAKSGGKK